MLAAIQAQKKSKQWEDGFIHNPANWLKGERWKDELSQEQKGSFDVDDFFQAACAHAERVFEQKADKD